MTENKKDISVTTTVFAHGGAIDTVNRHLNIWKKYTDNLLIISPVTDPCIINNVDCLTYEKSQHHGPLTLKRQLFGMKVSLLYESDTYVFLEYDAIILQKPKFRPNIIQGNLFNEWLFYNKDEKAIRNGDCFLHFPWIFPSDQLKTFVKEVDLSVIDHPLYDKKYCHDIWLAQKLMFHKYEIHNLLHKEGYSSNTIDDKNISDAIEHTKKGAYAFHGIKTKKILDQILIASNLETSND